MGAYTFSGMRSLIAFIFIVAGAGHAWAQDGFVGQTATLSYDVFDRNGKSFVNPAPEVAGSPFLTDEWKEGAVIIITNRRYDSVKIRLNVFSQEVHILTNTKNEIALAKGYIKEIIWPGKDRFQSGFPAVDNQDSNNFYEVLAEGKLWLLHSVRKVISERKDVMSSEVAKEYTTFTDDYIYDGKTMLRVKKGKAIVGDKEIKFKTIDQLKTAIEAYNAS